MFRVLLLLSGRPERVAWSIDIHMHGADDEDNI